MYSRADTRTARRHIRWQGFRTERSAGTQAEASSPPDAGRLHAGVHAGAWVMQLAGRHRLCAVCVALIAAPLALVARGGEAPAAPSAPTILVVTTWSDAVRTSGGLTLRQALERAAADPGDDVIRFDPALSGERRVGVASPLMYEPPVNASSGTTRSKRRRDGDRARRGRRDGGAERAARDAAADNVAIEAAWSSGCWLKTAM